jgi:hypothetical protein
MMEVPRTLNQGGRLRTSIEVVVLEVEEALRKAHCQASAAQWQVQIPEAAMSVYLGVAGVAAVDPKTASTTMTCYPLRWREVTSTRATRARNLAATTELCDIIAGVKRGSGYIQPLGNCALDLWFRTICLY